MGTNRTKSSETGGILQVNNLSYPSTMEPRSESIKPEVLDLLARADLDSIARKRRENLAYLLQGIASIDGLRPMRNNIPLAPQSLPVWIDGDKFREKLYFRLIERSIPTTALYYRLHSFLKHEDYPDSFDVSDHILNLPIHQDMVLEQLDQLLDEIRFVLEELHA